MNHNLKYGLFYGFISIAITVAIIFIDYTLFTSSWISFISIVIGVVILVVAGLELRKEQGGFLSFGKAFQSTFIIYLIATVISLSYTALQFNVLTPDVAEKLQKIQVNKTVATLEQFGADDQAIDQAVADSAKFKFGSPLTLLIALGGAVVIGAIVSLIIGAIVKKKEPAFD